MNDEPQGILNHAVGMIYYEYCIDKSHSSHNVLLFLMLFSYCLNTTILIFYHSLIYEQLSKIAFYQLLWQLLQKGSFPVQLKVAKVIPLHKGDPKKEIENWRPISILPLFSKLLEKVVHNRLYGFLQSNSLLSETQFGFCKGHSMTNALQHLVESVNSGIDRGETPLAIIIDIRKAFDTVDF